MPNIYMLASWLLLILVTGVAWRRSPPELKLRNTLVAAVVFFAIHALLAFQESGVRLGGWRQYFMLFWNPMLWWLSF